MFRVLAVNPVLPAVKVIEVIEVSLDLRVPRVTEVLLVFRVSLVLL